MALTTIAEQTMGILAEYLEILASREELSDEIREMARIGTDVIAASMQADQIARWSLHGFGQPNHDIRPLGVFAMTRSSVYGLHYLYNLKTVREKTKMVSIATFIKNNEKNWNSSILAERFGILDHNREERNKKWNQLSEVVHIIPIIRERGGTTISSHTVNFSFNKDLSKPSRHALLPEYFNEEARQYLDWRSKIAIGCLIGFRERFSPFFSAKALPTKVYSALVREVWPDFNEHIRGIADLLEGDYDAEVMDLADLIF